jgi:alpha-L-fucosidase
MYNMDEEIGTLSNIMFSKGLCFTPSEINMSIRPGWFWHEKEEPHSLDRLYKTWLTSYGANACMHLNIPPDQNGLIDSRDVNRIAEFGKLLQREFGCPILCHQYPKKEEEAFDYQPVYRITLPKPLPQQSLRHIVLREDIAIGQRVESFKVKARYENGRCYSIYEGTCIGNRKICDFADPFALQNPLTDDREGTRVTDIIVHVTAARGPVKLKEIAIY